MGLYSATKFGDEGFREALHAEMKDFRINDTMIGPNSFKTDFLGFSAKESMQIEAYKK